jgi:hypothetical protein
MPAQAHMHTICHTHDPWTHHSSPTNAIAPVGVANELGGRSYQAPSHSLRHPHFLLFVCQAVTISYYCMLAGLPTRAPVSLEASEVLVSIQS